MNDPKRNGNIMLFVAVGAGVLIVGALALAFRNNTTNRMMEDTSQKMMENETTSENETMTDDALMKDDNKMAGDDVMVKEDDSMMKDDQSMNNSGSYVDYSPQAYAAASSKKRVLFFHASWCPTCKVANQDLTENGDQLPADVVVFKTDYDTETALKQKYNITYQHTFVLVDAQGNELATWNGGGVADIIKQTAQV